MGKIKLAFICVHNSCRCQIAEAFAKKTASDIFDVYSAGTVLKSEINQDAVRLMKEIYHIDMEKSQYSKLISDLPEIDIGITMGCDVACPAYFANYKEDWGVDDPTGKDDGEFIKIIDEIYVKVLDLKKRVETGKLSIDR